MTKNLPATNAPAEGLAISPEALEVANTYLEHQNIERTAELLCLSTDAVIDYLERREVKTYIDAVFIQLGFNNRFRLRKAMDALISKKFQELDEAGVGSNKDIAELLMMSHKMTMDEMSRQLELEKMKQKERIVTQTNIQINDNGGSSYTKLLQDIMTGNVIQHSD